VYLLYFLRDQIHYSRLFPGHKAEDGLLILVFIYSAALILAEVAGGVISDRSGRRRLPLMVSGLVMAIPQSCLRCGPHGRLPSPRP
jgi:MFS family permease